MKARGDRKTIDFTSIDWGRIELEKLRFFLKEAVDYNDIILRDINRLNGKAFQLLAVAIAALSAATGFLLASWNRGCGHPLVTALFTACAGLFLAVVFLLLAVFPRSVYPGRLTPNIAFKGNLYKAPMTKLLADCIASYDGYISSNKKVLGYRSTFLTAGVLGIFAVPLLTLAAFLIRLPS